MSTVRSFVAVAVAEGGWNSVCDGGGGGRLGCLGGGESSVFIVFLISSNILNRFQFHSSSN